MFAVDRRLSLTLTGAAGAGKLSPVWSVALAFSCRSWVVVAAALAAWLLAARANAQMHGYVEPCSISFVEDGNTTCEECPFDHSNPAACARSLGSRGYTFKCRTRGHSAPAEVWCKPREGSELPRSVVLGGVVAGVASFAAAFLWWKRRAAS